MVGKGVVQQIITQTCQESDQLLMISAEVTPARKGRAGYTIPVMRKILIKKSMTTVQGGIRVGTMVMKQTMKLFVLNTNCSGKALLLP